MLKVKWTALAVAVAVVSILASGAYAQQSRGNASLIESQGPFAFSPAVKKIKRAAIGKCRHQAVCQYCCFFPNSGNTTCVFDVEFCGQ